MEVKSAPRYSFLPRDTTVFVCGCLVLFRLSSERNTAKVYMRRSTTLVEHDMLVWQNDHATLTTDVQYNVDFDDDDDEDRPLPFPVYDSLFNFTINSTAGMGDFANDFFHGTMCHRMFNTTSSTVRALADRTTTTNESASASSSSKDDTTTVRAALIPKSVVRIQFNCQHLFTKSIYGTGNFISAVYALRLAANVRGNVYIEYVCTDAEAEKANLILPWLTGYFPAPAVPAAVPTLPQACSSYKTVPIGHMFDTAQWELRRMAIALVGIPTTADHPAQQWAVDHLHDRSRAPFMQIPVSLDDPPIYNNVELDDAVLHFRCGDLISSTHPAFGFMKFGSYSRHLDKSSTKSIGIVTQPFDSDNNAQVRNYDGGQSNKDKCRRVVYALVDHLQHEFPNAKIAIRNDAKETIALTFARMIMARQVVIGISSFGVFPAIATFGQAYIRRPDYPRAPNKWLLNNPNIESVAPYVHLVDEPKLMAVTCKNKWHATNGTAVLDWFQNYTMTTIA
jgi:hypothetical protein